MASSLLARYSSATTGGNLVRPAGSIPVTGHDIPVDLVVTPERIIDCRPGRGPRPAPTVSWPELTEAKIAAIPLLTALRPGR